MLRTHGLVPALFAALALAAPLAAQCPDGTPPPCRGVRPAPAPLPTVAVLPFESRSPDSNDLYLAEGIADELTARLGRLGRIVVRSQSAARAFRGGQQSPQAVGVALNAVFLVTGSVRRAGARVRVSVELTRASAAERVWGEQYDRTADDVLRLEDEVAEAVATAVAGRIAPSERARLVQDRTRSPSAYDHYLKGLFQLRQRTPAAMAIAWDEFSAAVAADPAFVDAHAQLGAVGNIIAIGGLTTAGVSPESMLARGERETQLALRLDSNSAQAWVNVSSLRAFRYPTTYAGVREAAERAFQLDSTNDQICYVVGNHLVRLGDMTRGMELFRRAHVADPLNARTLMVLSFAQWFQGRRADALATMDTLVSISAGARDALGQRAYHRLLVGDTAGARADLLAARRARTRQPSVQELVARLALGDSAGIGAWVDSVNAVFARDSNLATTGLALAAALVARGATGAALDVLERGHPHDIQTGFTLSHVAWFGPLARDPRFQALLAEMAPPPGGR